MRQYEYELPSGEMIFIAFMLHTTLGTLNQNSVAEVYSFYFESATLHQFAALALSMFCAGKQSAEVFTN